MSVVSRAVPSSLAGHAPEGEALPETPDHVFDTVYETYAPFVWRSLRRLGVAEAHLADATQDVFVVVHRGLAGFEQRSRIRTWLFGIVLRVASEWRRKARRRPTEPLPETLVDGGAPTPFDQAARQEATAVLLRLLDRLSPEQRAVFVLVELEELSLPEAAETLGANLYTVTSRLRAARRKFEEGVRRHTASVKRGF